MNILRKLNGALLLMLSGAILTTIPACKKSDSGGGTPTPKPTITSFTPKVAPAGATVTITGTNLTGATAVKFGSSAAKSFKVDNATTITAVVNTGSSGDVSVTTPGGTASLAGFTFAPVPTLTSYTPNPAKIVSGGFITITGTGFIDGNTTVKNGTTTLTNVVVINSTTINVVLSGSGSQNLSLTVTTPGGTTAPLNIPITYQTATTNNAYAIISGDATLSSLKSIIDKGEIKSILQDPDKKFTIFAPVNTGLTANGLTPSGLDQLASELIVAYHTIDGKYTTADLAKDVPAGQNQKYFTIATPNNQQDSVFVTKFNNTVYVNGIDIDATQKDISVDNGIIHKLNSQYGVLFPPFRDAVDYIYRPSTSPSGLDSLAKAIKRAGTAFPGGLSAFENVLKNTVVTIIAPTNKAFQDFMAGQATIKKIDDWAPQALLNLLADHLIIGRYFTPNFLFATSPLGGSTGVKNYGNVPVKFGNPFALYLNPQKGVSIAIPDIMVLNGTVHKVSQIMFR